MCVRREIERERVCVCREIECVCVCVCKEIEKGGVYLER